MRIGWTFRWGAGVGLGLAVMVLISGCAGDSDTGQRSRSGVAASASPKAASATAKRPSAPARASLPRRPERPRIDLSNAVGFIGPVRERSVEWEPGLTLAEALVEAEYVGAGQPREILLNRQGQVVFINVKKLMRNLENPVLQPGDVVEIRP